MADSPNHLFPKLEKSITALNLNSISKERRNLLQPLIDHIQEKVNNQKPVRLNFICTHNSRRSHLSQAWAQAMAAHYKIPGVVCYSGGTEATALFPKAAKTLQKQGFEITKVSEGNNRVYSIKFAENEHPVIGFSKTFDHAFNPISDFAAIMTCSQADEGCPFIPGAERRFPITYDDPKAFDGTDEQNQKYLERSTQIATELNFVFSNIKLS